MPRAVLVSALSVTISPSAPSPADATLWHWPMFYHATEPCPRRRPCEAEFFALPKPLHGFRDLPGTGTAIRRGAGGFLPQLSVGHFQPETVGRPSKPLAKCRSHPALKGRV